MYEDKPVNPLEELKRADHLVTVSMKYSRTCAVMVNGLIRMVAAIDLACDDVLEHYHRLGKVKEVPGSRKEKMALLKEFVPSSLKKYFTLYTLFKTITESEYKAEHEFRKNVCLTTIGKKQIVMTQPELIDYLAQTKLFVKELGAMKQ